jgi:replicative DNA helicase
MYHVVVQGKPNQKKFLTQIGCIGQRAAMIPSILENLDQIKTNPNNDVIPKTVWATSIKAAKERSQLGWRDVCKGLNTSYCGSSLFKSGISRERMGTLSRFFNDPALQNLAESDVYWDEISSITKLGEEDVYDATVPGVHNFVANDIVVHNSLEQDSDVVMFLLRREYYDPYDKPGLAELIVAKNRHGAIGTVNLTFRKEIAQFANYTALGSGAEIAKANKEAFSAFSPDD